MKITNKIKEMIWRLFCRHPKIYTIIILAIGIALGCSYDGRDEVGAFYFKIGSQVYYVGALQ